jgi:hypothetical protein
MRWHDFVERLWGAQLGADDAPSSVPEANSNSVRLNQEPPKVMDAILAKADIHQERHRNSVCNRVCSQGERTRQQRSSTSAQNQ